MDGAFCPESLKPPEKPPVSRLPLALRPRPGVGRGGHRAPGLLLPSLAKLLTEPSGRESGWSWHHRGILENIFPMIFLLLLLLISMLFQTFTYKNIRLRTPGHDLVVPFHFSFCKLGDNSKSY